MTPQQALTRLAHLVAMIDALLPAFHRREDRADLHDARIALDAVARRLETQHQENECGVAYPVLPVRRWQPQRPVPGMPHQEDQR